MIPKSGYRFSDKIMRKGRSVKSMPYATNSQLPDPVRDHLPDHAQDIYRAAFNSAYAAHSGEAECERRAHMIAWAAVKRTYYKRGDEWVARMAVAS